jgi:hypothetical protein
MLDGFSRSQLRVVTRGTTQCLCPSRSCLLRFLVRRLDFYASRANQDWRQLFEAPGLERSKFCGLLRLVLLHVAKNVVQIAHSLEGVRTLEPCASTISAQMCTEMWMAAWDETGDEKSVTTTAFSKSGERALNCSRAWKNPNEFGGLSAKPARPFKSPSLPYRFVPCDTD